MKYKDLILPIAVSFLLVGCNVSTSTNTDDFISKWADSNNNSAVSWWYLGETNESYYIKEKWPTKQTIYNISKQNIKINGIQAFKYKTEVDPINLKSNNVIINENAL